MKYFTLIKKTIGNSLLALNSFKSFAILVVLFLMTTSNALGEVIDGLRFQLDEETKTATLLAKINGHYSGDIIVPEKIRGIDGLEYLVTNFEEECFQNCENLTSITIPSSITLLEDSCFAGCSKLSSITILLL